MVANSGQPTENVLRRTGRIVRAVEQVGAGDDQERNAGRH